MSKTKNYLHLVFGTKYRHRTITPDRKARLYEYITGVVKNKNSELIKINGMEDHLHLLINLHPSVSLADMVKTIKVSASKMITSLNLFPYYEGWAAEYYACSVSPSHVEAVKEYISNQEEHHRGKGYDKEIADFVTKMGLQLYNDEV